MEKKSRRAIPDLPEDDLAATQWAVSRRDFLKASGVALIGFSLGQPFVHAGDAGRKARIRFGIVADVHYADTCSRGIRHYRESLDKMDEFTQLMNDKGVDFIVELGDFKDEKRPATAESALRYLERIEDRFKQFNGRRYHVLGNHDMDSLSKRQFRSRVESSGISSEEGYYSFDSNGFHFVVLDANYTADGLDYDSGNFDWKDANIPPKELEWLRNDIASTSAPVIVFVHQQLDGADRFCIRNAGLVRRILQDASNVVLVLQGHQHAGGYRRIEGIHYYTLKAMVDGSGETNSSYAIVEVFDNLDVAVTGYRRAVSKDLAA